MAYSQAGSLLYLLAGDELKTVQADEVASISPADFEDSLASWMYSAYDADYGHGAPDLDIKPPPIVKG